MDRRRIAVWSLLTLICSSFTTASSAKAQCATGSIARADATHPCQFIQITEVEKRDSSWLLFGRHSLGARRRGNVNGSKEVDVQSVLHIAYADTTMPPGLSVGIEAFLRHDKKEIAIPVPGYSMIGEAKKRVELRAVTASDLVYRVQILSNARNAIDSVLRKASGNDAQALSSDKTWKDAMSALAQNQKTLHALHDDSAAKALALEKLHPAVVLQDLNAQSQANTLAQALIVLKDTLGKLRAASFDLALKAGEATNTKELIDNSNRGTLEDLLRLIKRQTQARAVIKSLEDSANQSLLIIISSVAQTPMEVLASDLSTLRRSFEAIDSVRGVPDEKTMKSLVTQHANAISAAMADLARNHEKYVAGNPDYDAAVASLLPSTDIALAPNNAEPGDRVIIRITTVDLHQHRRVTDFPVDVGSYGIVRGITDSFLFLNRVVPEGLEDKMIRKRAADYLGKSGLDRELLSPVVNVPVGSRVAPTAGVTYGWIWHPRESTSAFREWGRAFHPGWGVNVSFPSYRTKQVTIVPPETTADSANTASIEPNAEETQTDLALSLGGVLSMFDGAFQFSGGRILNAPSRRWYWALGISFVGLTTAGKELYGKLTNPK